MVTLHIEGGDGVGKYLNDKDKAKSDLAKTLATAARAWRETYGEIPLPNQVVSTQETEAPGVDFHQQTYELMHLVREPSVDEREALEKRKGLVFLPVNAKSLAEFVSENPDHFWSDELEYANSRAELKDYVPPVMEVGLNPTQLALPDSFLKSQAVQLEMIDNYSKYLEVEFPDARAIMLPVTGYAQADKAYLEKTGQVLFRTYFARALDNTSGVDAAFVGRAHPDDQLLVRGWFADRGLDHVGAVPAVVFLRK